MNPEQFVAYQSGIGVLGQPGRTGPTYYYDSSLAEEDTLGMIVTSGQVKIVKDKSNLIGISIGGGAPNCPCLYVIQIFDNSPAAKEGNLQPGDEITAVNGKSVKGRTRNETAQAIQESKGHVVINYNQLHVDPEKSKSLDIVLKKFKHRITEALGSSTSDTFGLSRAILANDNLVKRLAELERNEIIYTELRDRMRKTFRAFAELNRVYKQFGLVFTEIGCREKQPQAYEAFRSFGETHRAMDKYGVELLNEARDIISDLSTYITKAIPDTKLTVKKYQDVKFEYLSYCLKVKEMDDEEQDYYSIHEPLYRVDTGNYEYRLVLRCRQESRQRFNKLREDVNAKIELLDHKHVQHLSTQLMRIISALTIYNESCLQLFSQFGHHFPLNLDLSKCFDFNYFDDEQNGEENEQHEQSDE